MRKFLSLLALLAAPVFADPAQITIIREAAGGAISTCDDVTGLVAWYDAELGITQDVGVTTWADQKNSYDFTQTTDAAEPVYNATCQNSLACVEFDNTADYMSASEMVDVSTSGTGVTVVMVFTSPSTVTNRYWFGQADGTGTGATWVGGVNQSGVKFVSYIGGTASSGTTAASASTDYILILTYDGNTSGAVNMYLNGGSDEVTETATGVAADGSVILGANRTLTQFNDLKMMELCVYNVPISASDAGDLATALNSKWAMY